VKFTVKGETFEVDLAHMPMSDALAIENESKRRYAEWESEFYAGSAWASCVLVWLAWKHDGREVPLGDILSGEVDFDYSDVLRSIMDALAQAAAEVRAGEADPTEGAAPPPDGTATTLPATKGSSLKSST
jgi:hypothetical protein